jgi:putative endonuclease
MHYLYVLECRGGHLYLGVTVDPRERWWAHATGRGARFTREHPAEKLVYVEPFDTMEAAEVVERSLVRDLAALRHPLRVAGGPLTGFEPPRAPTADQVQAARAAWRDLGEHSRGKIYEIAHRPPVAV